MSFKRCLLLSHVWIKEGQEYKKDIIHFSVEHFRKNNDNLYIILTGHGEALHRETLGFCDNVDWRHPLIESEIGKGHPQLVDIGLKHAKVAGFQKVLKQRADCIVPQKNVHSFYDQMMGEDSFLAADLGRGIGALLMYGDINIFFDGWRPEEWDKNVDGVENFNNFISEDNRNKTMISNASSMKWVFLDPHWESIVEQNMQEKILNNEFNHDSYLWGTYSRRAQNI